MMIMSYLVREVLKGPQRKDKITLHQEGRLHLSRKSDHLQLDDMMTKRMKIIPIVKLFRRRDPNNLPVDARVLPHNVVLGHHPEVALVEMADG
jgi:hypothetical protein